MPVFADRGAADDAHRRIAIEKHLFGEILQVQVTALRPGTNEFRIEVEHAGQTAERQRPGYFILHVVQLRVEYEFRPGIALEIGVGGLRPIDQKIPAEDLIQRQESRCHAAGAP